MRKLTLIVGVILLLQLVIAPASSAAPPPSGGFWHTVGWGETLFSIGRMYGVNAYTICSVNGLRNCNYIWAGQALWIPSGGYVPPPGGYCIAYHTVTWGQTLHSIGRWYGVSPWAIASANGIYNLNLIYAGQTLCIPDP
jgi:LysM repeat protein